MQQISIVSKMRRIALAAAIASLAAVAGPPTITCLGPAIGIPANSTPPNWWDPPAQPYASKLDDPRWVGAGSVTFGDGTSNVVEFRGLQDATFVYLSWRMRHVVVGTTDNSILYFGIQDPNVADTNQATAQNLIGKVNLKTNGSQEAQPPGAIADLSAFLRQADGTGTPLNPRPSWMLDTLRVWTNSPDANSWGVEVRIPKTSLQLTGSTYKMWFQIVTGTLGSPIASLSWPTTAVLTQANFNDVYPDPSTWRTFQFSSGPSDATCATAGVSLDWTQIGTLNADPHQISLVSANTFIARPQNNSGAAIPTGAITARFRLANWGSSPSGWEAGVDPNVLWSTIPGGDAVPTGGIINDDTLATNTTGNHFQWTVSGADLAAFQNGTRLLHQCMLVELTSSLANLQFANNSVRRNMDFVNASKFERQARLTIKGLKPIAPAGRDMYIWIETLNMPAKAVQGGPPPQLKTTIPGTPVTDPTRPPQIGVFKTNAAAPLPPAPGYNPPQDGKPVPVPDGEGLQALLAKGEVTQQQIEAVVPMYIAHVYHDTGQKLRFGGVDRPVLGTQDSFEYIVTHKGDLYGWEHQLTAQGSVLEQIAPDFYRIHDVPNDGTVTVTSTILALETAPSPLPWWWWIVALIILLLIVLWFLVKK